MLFHHALHQTLSSVSSIKMDQSTHVHHPNDYNYHSAHERRSNSARKPSRWYRIRRVTTWQQIFQIGVASASFVAGAGVGREVLHDPLATAEGVLNFPIVVSQVAVILTEAFLVGERICTSLLSGTTCFYGPEFKKGHIGTMACPVRRTK